MLARSHRFGSATVSWFAAMALTVACHHEGQASANENSAPKAEAPLASSPKPAAKVAELPRRSAPGRIVAVGDIHGDLAAAQRVLRMAKVIDNSDQWIGGNSVVVQTGDLLDRGNDERQLLEWMERLSAVATAGGGALYRLNGNHEVMNVAGDLRYVTDAGFEAFAEYAAGPIAAQLREAPAAQRGRLAAFLPGGAWARRLAQYPVVLVVNQTVFTHGGLLPKHLDYGLERINAEVSAWMRGTGKLNPATGGDDSPFWNRTYGDKVSESDCHTLEVVLARLSVKQLVVGHTPQKGGITFACERHVVRIDVGLSSYYGKNPAAALEIQGDTLRVLTEASDPVVPSKKPARQSEAHP